MKQLVPLLALGMVLCLPSFGAVAFVQASSGGTQGSATARSTGATSTTAHNTIVVFTRTTLVQCSDVSMSVTDTAGNTYSQIASVDGASICFRAFIARDITANASNVITGTSSVATIFGYLSALEFSGVDKDHPRDMGFGQVDTATTMVCNPFSTFVADEAIVIGLHVDALGESWTAASGYTIPSGATSPDNIVSAQYKIASTLQTDVTTSAITTNNTGKTMLGVGLRGAGSLVIRHKVTAQ